MLGHKIFRNNLAGSCVNLVEIKGLLLVSLEDASDIFNYGTDYYSWGVQINLTPQGRPPGRIRGESTLAYAPLLFVDRKRAHCAQYINEK